MTTPQAISVDEETIRYLSKLEGVERGLQIARLIMLEEITKKAKQQQVKSPETQEAPNGD